MCTVSAEKISARLAAAMSHKQLAYSPEEQKPSSSPPKKETAGLFDGFALLKIDDEI